MTMRSRTVLLFWTLWTSAVTNNRSLENSIAYCRDVGLLQLTIIESSALLLFILISDLLLGFILFKGHFILLTVDHVLSNICPEHVLMTTGTGEKLRLEIHLFFVAELFVPTLQRYRVAE